MSITTVTLDTVWRNDDTEEHSEESSQEASGTSSSKKAKFQELMQSGNERSVDSSSAHAPFKPYVYEDKFEFTEADNEVRDCVYVCVSCAG